MKNYALTSLSIVGLMVGCGNTPKNDNANPTNEPPKFVAEVVTGNILYGVNKDSKAGGKKENPGIDWADINTLPVNAGAWLAVDQNGKLDDKTDWAIKGNVLTRATKTKFGRGVAFVINNSDGALTGNYPFSFEYFLKDVDPATKDVFSVMGYRVTGIPTNNWQGIVNLSSGNGAFAGAGASAVKVEGSKELKAKNKLPLAENWVKESALIDVTDMKWIVVSFGLTYRENVSGQPSDYIGIKNVMVPAP